MVGYNDIHSIKISSPSPAVLERGREGGREGRKERGKEGGEKGGERERRKKQGQVF